MPTPPHLRLITSTDRTPGAERPAEASLLSAEDLAEIRRYGVPAEVRADLVQKGREGVRLSAKGREYYEQALRLHVAPRAVAPVLSQTEFAQLEDDIFSSVRQKVRGELKAEFDAGRIDPQDREFVVAKLYGSVVGLCVALRRSLTFKAAGENVIPLTRKKKRRD